MIRGALTFSYHYPRLILLLLVVLTVVVAPKLQDLKFDISAQALVVKNDQYWDIYQNSLQQFGSDSVVLVVVSDDRLFSGEKLAVLKLYLEQLEDLEFITGSHSLFNVPNVKEVDGFIESKPFLFDLPQTEQQSQQLIDDALANAMVESNLVSRDRKTMALNLVLNEEIEKGGQDRQVATEVEMILEAMRNEFETVYQLSSPYVRNEISQQLRQDIESIMPAALAVLIIVLGFSMRRLNCSVVPMSSAVISIVLTLAFMAQMQIPINVLTSIIPALLIIIGSTEDVHLMAEYHGGIRKGLSRLEAVESIPVNQSMAITLAFVTTFVGFLSITISNLELLRQFGLLVSFGLLINFLVTILFVPAYLSLFGGTTLGLIGQRNLFQRLAHGIYRLVIRFKVSTLILSLALAVFFGWQAQHLSVNHNTLSYFSDESEILRRAEQLHQDLSGMQTFSVILDSSIEGTFKKVRYLNELERLQQFIDDRGVFDKTVSFSDFIKLTNQVMEGTSQPELPLEDEVVQVYMEFVQFEAVSSYVNPDFSSTRLLVRHNIASSNELQKEFDQILHFVEHDLNSSLEVVLTGESVLHNHAADSMVAGQIQSLILMVFVILLLVSVLFVDYRAGLIALIPNVFPVVVLFGVMGHFGIPLDTGTAMVAIIALGICVDDTIHFLSRYHTFTRTTDDVYEALRKTIESESTPISTTSVGLTLGFLTLTLSSFQPVVYFGALSALVMILAMFSTFVLTPVLLSFTKLVTVWDMLSLNYKSDVLRNSEIFKGLKNLQIRQAILSGTIKNFNRGDVIIDQGIVGNEFYVMLDGAATATHRDEDGSVQTLSYLKAGDLFGEVAELSQRKRMARVTADQQTQVLEMRWDEVKQLGRFHPRIAMLLYRNLADILSKRFVQVSEEKRNPRDELTGALTKPFLCELLHQEVKRSRYFEEDMSLMLLDIDIKPKDGNVDQTLADIIIYAITKIIRYYIQPTDVFARWEKCSFMIVLPRAESNRAVELAETLQQTIEQTDVADQAILRITTAVTSVRPNEKGSEAIERLESKLEKLKQKSLTIAVA